MTGIIKREFHVFAAESFVDEINTEGNQENNMFLGIGKTSAWPDDNNPPVPVDSDQETADFWTNIAALALINATDAALVVPKKVWTLNANNYQIFDPTANASTAYAANFYVLNSENYVYEITTVPVDTVANPSTVEPTGAGDVADAGDGYTYRYLYGINLIDNKFITSNWMPVEFEVNYNAADPKHNHLILGSKYAMIHAVVANDGIIPTNISYRQVSVLRNPLLNDNADDDLKSNATAGEIITFTDLHDGTEATKVVRETGEIMYLENKSPINRDPSQSEEIKLILEF